MIEVAKKLTFVANREIAKSELNHYSDAHISARDSFTDTVVFKAADAELNQESMIAVSCDSGKIVEGIGKLPSDAAIHLALYRKYPQIQSIAHIYPLMTVCVSHEGRDMPVITKYHAEHFHQLIPCACIPDGPESSTSLTERMASAVIKKLEAQEVLSYGAMLLQCDGALVWNETPLKTITLGDALEKTANLAWNLQMKVGCDASSPAIDVLLKSFKDSKPMLPYDREPGVPGTKVTPRQIKGINLNLVEYFDKVCRENGIKYSLTGGSLIGVVRHGGFIPWDDDVDVFLTRPEYDKLINVFPDGGRYEFVNFQKDPTFNYPFAWLVDTWTTVEYSTKTAGIGRGVSLDVCVVDGLPNNKLLRTLHIKRMTLLFRLRRATIHNPLSVRYKEKGSLVILLKRIHRTITDVHFWTKIILKEMRKYPFQNSQFAGNFTSQYGAKELVHSSVFSNYFDVKFEGLTLMACIGYHEFLTGIYGNYLELPTEEKQKGHHMYLAHWTKNE